MLKIWKPCCMNPQNLATLTQLRKQSRTRQKSSWRRILTIPANVIPTCRPFLLQTPAYVNVLSPTRCRWVGCSTARGRADDWANKGHALLHAASPQGQGGNRTLLWHLGGGHFADVFRVGFNENNTFVFKTFNLDASAFQKEDRSSSSSVRINAGNWSLSPQIAKLRSPRLEQSAMRETYQAQCLLRQVVLISERLTLLV